jgi:hypothetical protein
MEPYLYDRNLSFEVDTVTVYGQITVGAAGAVASFKGGGIADVVKETAAGQYTITLKKKLARLLGVKITPVKATATGIVQTQVISADLQGDFTGDGKVVIQCLDETPAAVNPASGEILLIEIIARRSSVGPFDA